MRKYELHSCAIRIIKIKPWTFFFFYNHHRLRARGFTLIPIGSYLIKWWSMIDEYYLEGRFLCENREVSVINLNPEKRGDKGRNAAKELWYNRWSGFSTDVAIFRNLNFFFEDFWEILVFYSFIPLFIAHWRQPK